MGCNPLEKVLHCQKKKKKSMLLHGVYWICYKQPPDANYCCAICLQKLPFLYHSSLSYLTLKEL